MSTNNVAARQAAAQLTTRSTESVVALYTQWLESKPDQETARTALIAVSESSKYPSRVLSNAEDMYLQIGSDLPTTGQDPVARSAIAVGAGEPPQEPPYDGAQIWLDALTGLMWRYDKAINGSSLDDSDSASALFEQNLDLLAQKGSITALPRPGETTYAEDHFRGGYNDRYQSYTLAFEDAAYDQVLAVPFPDASELEPEGAELLVNASWADQMDTQHLEVTPTVIPRWGMRLKAPSYGIDTLLTLAQTAGNPGWGQIAWGRPTPVDGQWTSLGVMTPEDVAAIKGYYASLDPTIEVTLGVLVTNPAPPQAGWHYFQQWRLTMPGDYDFVFPITPIGAGH